MAWRRLRVQKSLFSLKKKKALGNKEKKGIKDAIL